MSPSKRYGAERAPRTYRDLLTLGQQSTHSTCCSCHRSWYDLRNEEHSETYRLSTRAHICYACCVRKGDQVLGSVLKAERAVKRYIRDGIKRGEDITKEARFFSSLSGAPLEFVEAEIKRAMAA